MTQRPQDKTPQEKMSLVMRADALKEDELGAFLRQEGIQSSDLQQWRTEMLAALQTQAQNSEVRELKKKNKLLQKELSRKEAALAETAALLVLQKKVQQLWGDEEKNT